MVGTLRLECNPENQASTLAAVPIKSSHCQVAVERRQNLPVPNISVRDVIFAVRDVIFGVRDVIFAVRDVIFAVRDVIFTVRDVIFAVPARKCSGTGRTSASCTLIRRGERGPGGSALTVAALPPHPTVRLCLTVNSRKMTGGCASDS